MNTRPYLSLFAAGAAAFAVAGCDKELQEAVFFCEGADGRAAVIFNNEEDALVLRVFRGSSESPIQEAVYYSGNHAETRRIAQSFCRQGDEAALALGL